MNVLSYLRSGSPLQFLAVLFVVLGWMFAPSVYTFFIAVFIIWAAFRFDSRIIAGVALLFLVLLPILLATGHPDKAEQIAVYVFFLLTMTVALQILELVRSPRSASIPAQVRVRKLVVHHVSRQEILRARIDGIIPRRLSV